MRVRPLQKTVRAVKVLAGTKKSSSLSIIQVLKPYHTTERMIFGNNGIIARTEPALPRSFRTGYNYKR